MSVVSFNLWVFFFAHGVHPPPPFVPQHPDDVFFIGGPSPSKASFLYFLFITEGTLAFPCSGLWQNQNASVQPESMLSGSQRDKRSPDFWSFSGMTTLVSPPTALHFTFSPAPQASCFIIPLFSCGKSPFLPLRFQSEEVAFYKTTPLI